MVPVPGARHPLDVNERRRMPGSALRLRKHCYVRHGAGPSRKGVRLLTRTRDQVRFLLVEV